MRRLQRLRQSEKTDPIMHRVTGELARRECGWKHSAKGGTRYARPRRGPPRILMSFSSSFLGDHGRSILIVGAISQHRPKDVDPPSSEGDHGLGVPLTL
jgi:hypothetical protein